MIYLVGYVLFAAGLGLVHADRRTARSWPLMVGAFVLAAAFLNLKFL